MNDAVQFLAELPSPTQSVWNVGPLPIRGYALCILAGIIAACAIAEVRLRRRGAPKWMVLDVAVWAVPFGIIGARLYHVITSPDDYFGADGDPLAALEIWRGGLGIWGAVAGGALGAMIACHRLNVPLTFFADALAPGLPVAQAIGRIGNWFNNELFGGPTSLPWALRVYEFDLGTGEAKTFANGEPIPVMGGPFHPTFLYELVWNLGVALFVWLVDRRWKLGKGRAFALYVMGYTVGRFWIEAMRTDVAHEFAGMRVNNWVAIVVFLGALLYFLRVKGPQEFVRVGEDGTLTLVTAGGEPIEWRKPAREDDDNEDDDNENDDNEDDEDDGDGGPDSGAGSDDGDQRTADESAGTPKK